MLRLRSDHTESVSVDLHQQRLDGNGHLLSSAMLAVACAAEKIKSRHSRSPETPAAVGHKRSATCLARASATDGLQPLPAAERTGAIDPLRPVAFPESSLSPHSLALRAFHLSSTTANAGLLSNIPGTLRYANEWPLEPRCPLHPATCQRSLSHRRAAPCAHSNSQVTIGWCPGSVLLQPPEQHRPGILQLSSKEVGRAVPSRDDCLPVGFSLNEVSKWVMATSDCPAHSLTQPLISQPRAKLGLSSSARSISSTAALISSPK